MEQTSIAYEPILLVGSVLMLAGIMAGKVGTRFGVPALLLFLITGMLFGKVPADAVLEVPVDSVLEESYLKGIRRGAVPKGIDLRKQPKYPNPICE